MDAKKHPARRYKILFTRERLLAHVVELSGDASGFEFGSFVRLRFSKSCGERSTTVSTLPNASAASRSTRTPTISI